MEQTTTRRSRRPLIVGCAIPLIAFVILLVLFFANNRLVDIAIPTPTAPSPNAWDDFVRAGKMPKGQGPYSQSRPVSSWTIPEYESFMRDSAASLAVLRQGLTRPYRHPAVRGMERGHFDHYRRFRELARTLAGEARYYEVTGQYAKAMNSRLECVEFGVTLPQGGAVIAALVGAAIEAFGTHEIEVLLPKLKPAELERAAEHIERIRSKRVTFSEMMLEEAQVSASEAAELLKDPDFLRITDNPLNWFTEDNPLFWAEDKSLPGGGTKKGVRAIPRRVWRNATAAFANKSRIVLEIKSYHEALAKERRGPYTGKSSVPVPDNFLWPRLAYPSYCARFPLWEATLALIDTEIALRRYRADHGRYPARLSELTPAYLKKTPSDPFGGKHLPYRPAKNGQEFVLYSVGPDLRDDGGKPVKEHVRADAHGDLLLGKPYFSWGNLN